MNVLHEIFRIVGRLLPESVCRLCGYDNPYMDPVPDYVCRQCTVRTQKWGSSKVSSMDSSMDVFKREFDRLVAKGSIKIDRSADEDGAYTFVEGDEEYDRLKAEVEKRFGYNTSEYNEFEDYVEDWKDRNGADILEKGQEIHGK